MAIKLFSILISISIISFTICYNDTDLWQINENETNFNSFTDEIENQSEMVNVSIQLENDFENFIEKQQIKINYVVNLLCLNKSDYRYYHILVDESLETSLGDEILKSLSACLTAGLLTTM